MALQLVGQTVTSVVLTTGGPYGTSTTSHFLALDALSGGIATQPETGDFVMAWIMGGRGTGTIAAYVDHTGFNQIYSTFVTATELTRSYRVQVARKFLTDAAIDIATGLQYKLSWTTGGVYIMGVSVYRGARVSGPIFLGTGFLHSQDGAGRTPTNTGTVPIDTSTITVAGSRVFMVGATAGSTGSANHSHTWTGSSTEARIYHRADGTQTSFFIGTNQYIFDGTNRVVPGAWSAEDPETGEDNYLTRGTIIWPEPEPPEGLVTLPFGRCNLTSNLLMIEGSITPEVSTLVDGGTATLSGTFGVGAEIFPGQDVGMSSGSVSMVSTLTSDGTFIFTYAPPPVAQPTGGWIRRRPSGRRHSGSGRQYFDRRDTGPRKLPPAAQKVVDSAPEEYASTAHPQTLRDFITRRADTARMKL